MVEEAVPEPPPVSARWLCIWSCVAAALVAACLTFGDLPGGNTSDSLITVFVSLYRWTWFYWGQNRYGMLTALLAIPVHHPLLNLLFQNWMITFTGLLAFPLTSAYLLGWRGASLGGLVATAVFVLAAPNSFHADYLLAQPYAVSTCLGLAGLILLDSEDAEKPLGNRQLLGSVVCFLAYWVSLAAIFLVLPLFVLNWWLGCSRPRSSRRHFLVCVALILVPGVINWRIAASYPQGDFGWSPVLMWPGNLLTLIKNTYTSSSRTVLITTSLLLVGGLIAWRLVCAPARRRTDLRAFWVALASILVYAGVFAATEHVRRNLFPFRYALTSIVVLLAGTTFFAVSALAQRLRPRWQAALQGALLVGILVGTSLRYGTPSYARVHAAIDRKFGAATASVVENNCTHILGNYWDVWGAVFHANIKWYESGSKKIVWGLTGRTEGTRDLWYPGLDGGLIAVPRTPRSDEAWEKQITALKLPEMSFVRDTPTVRLFVPNWKTNDRIRLAAMVPQTAQVNLMAAGPIVPPPPDPAADAAQLRSYGPKEMSLAPCLRREDDGTIVGKNCPQGSLVFGPYVKVPRGATLRISFNVRTDTEVELVSDIVSGSGKLLHGSIDPAKLERGSARSFGYGIHMFEGANAAEARIGIRTNRPANLEITNLKLVAVR